MNEVEKLYELLRKIQEPKGYFFNRDREMVFEILDGLLVNKNRYGYMCCPCRLAAGNRDHDKDIICPCEYRASDIEQYGSCYCSLYVSQEWNDDKIPHEPVPERRPEDKSLF